MEVLLCLKAFLSGVGEAPDVGLSISVVNFLGALVGVRLKPVWVARAGSNLTGRDSEDSPVARTKVSVDKDDAGGTYPMCSWLSFLGKPFSAGTFIGRLDVALCSGKGEAGDTTVGGFDEPPIASYRCTMSDIEVLRTARGFASWGGNKFVVVGEVELSVDFEGKRNIDCGREREDVDGLVAMGGGCGLSLFACG